MNIELGISFVFTLYNRHEITKITFNFIKLVKPKVLFLLSYDPKNKQH